MDSMDRRPGASVARVGFALACVTASLVVGFPPAPASAQSGAEIVGRMLSEYQRRAEEVENYTIFQDAMGLETISYFEKVMEDGRPVFRLQRSSAGGMDVGVRPGEGSIDEIYSMGEELAERAAYMGIQRHDDYDVHVLEVADLSGMNFGRNMTADSEFVPTRGAVYLDVDTYAPRLMEFEGQMTNEEGVHPVSTTVEMGDYRELGGMLFAYRTVVTIEGLGAVIDPETRAQFEQMQAELENMPPAQREMVESMMAGQMEQFQAMMGGSDEPMRVQLLVTDVLVNAGPPPG